SRLPLMHAGLIARTDEVRAVGIAVASRKKLAESTRLKNDSPSAVAQLNRLVDREGGRAVGQEIVIGDIVPAGCALHADSQLDVSFGLTPRVDHPSRGDQIDVSQAGGVHLVTDAICVVAGVAAF